MTRRNHDSGSALRARARCAGERATLDLDLAGAVWTRNPRGPGWVAYV